jgi:hypothetical protein
MRKAESGSDPDDVPLEQLAGERPANTGADLGARDHSRHPTAGLNAAEIVAKLERGELDLYLRGRSSGGV